MTRLIALRERYGPVAVVTGASSGIGAATARELAAAGLDLVLVARTRGALQALADELTTRHRVRCTVLPVDLGTPDGPAAVLRATADLDVGLLVAAAGYGSSGRFLDADPAAESDQLDVNCRAVLLLAHGLGWRLAARGRGGLVLFGSLVGRQGTPDAAHYAATKAWVQALGEALHVELERVGVDVVTSTPGPVHSGFADRAGMRMGAAIDPATVARATLRGLLRRRTTVVPGGLSKLLTWSLAPLPRPLRTRILGQVMAGMTAHRREQAPA